MKSFAFFGICYIFVVFGVKENCCFQNILYITFFLNKISVVNCELFQTCEYLSNDSFELKFGKKYVAGEIGFKFLITKRYKILHRGF